MTRLLGINYKGHRSMVNATNLCAVNSVDTNIGEK